MSMALEQELQTYRRELPNLLGNPANRGRFALVHRDVVAGVYDTFQEALDAGYERFELEPFLVKQIVEQEKPIFFSRAIRCR